MRVTGLGLLLLLLVSCRRAVTPPPPVRDPLEELCRALKAPLVVHPGWKASWSPREREFAVGNQGIAGHEKGIDRVRLTEGEISVTPLAGTKDAKDPSWSPDGRWIAFVEETNGEDTVWVVDAERGGEAVRVGEGGYPFWPSPGRLYFHERHSGTVVSFRIDRETVRTGDFPVRREFLLGECWYPTGSRGNGRVVYWDYAWQRVLCLEEMIDWPLSQLFYHFGKHTMATFGDVSPDGELFFHGSDGSLAEGVWATYLTYPQDRFRIWDKPLRAPAVSADGRFMTGDRYSVGRDAWTVVVSLDLARERVREEMRAWALGAKGEKRLSEVVAFLRYLNPGRSPEASFVEMVGPERVADPRSRFLRDLVRAHLLIEDSPGREGPEAMVQGAIARAKGEEFAGKEAALDLARRLMAEALLAAGEYREAATELVQVSRSSGSLEDWWRTARLAELGKDLVLLREAATWLAEKGGARAKEAQSRALEREGEWKEGERLLSPEAPAVDAAKFHICVRADGKRALEILGDGPQADARGSYYRARGLLLEGRFPEALGEIRSSQDARGMFLALVILDRMGNASEGLNQARQQAEGSWPGEAAGLALSYILSRGGPDEVRDFLSRKGIPLLAHTALGAVARRAGSDTVLPSAPWPDPPRRAPDLPTAPTRALDLYRRGLEVPEGLLRKALWFARRMDLVFSGLSQRCQPAYRTGSMVALIAIAGLQEEAAWRLEVAIQEGEDPCAIWLDPDLVSLRDRGELKAVFVRHGVAAER